MPQHATAVFEKGCLKLLEPIENIPENSIVEILVEKARAYSTEDQLDALRNIAVSEELANNIESGRKQKWNVEEF
jgi:predicted DNA-binding antitoxin AbrB/MazE fold protein